MKQCVAELTTEDRCDGVRFRYQLTSSRHPPVIVVGGSKDRFHGVHVVLTDSNFFEDNLVVFSDEHLVTTDETSVPRLVRDGPAELKACLHGVQFSTP